MNVEYYKAKPTKTPQDELVYSELFTTNLPLKLKINKALKNAIKRNLMTFFSLTSEQADEEIEEYINFRK